MRENIPLVNIQRIDMPLSPRVARLKNDVVRCGYVGAIGRMMQIEGLDVKLKDNLEEAWSEINKLREVGALLGFPLQVCLARAA